MSKKMFHMFENSEERRKFGGSAFLELQYCRQKMGTAVEKIVSVDEIEHWDKDSLYVYLDDIDDFSRQYTAALQSGTYNNLAQGPVDIYGINYYCPEQMDAITEYIEKEKPIEYEVVLHWLERAKQWNGFYILGI